MDEGLRKDIAGRLGTLHRLKDLLPPEGISPLVKARVEEEMNDLISKGYEPFFSGNAALYILSACQRCGRCCKDINAIAASIEDCRRVAKRLGMSQKRFMMEYTRPHILDGCQVGTARVIRKRMQSTVFSSIEIFPAAASIQSSPGSAALRIICPR